jgi:hypothetical protein
MRTKSRIYDQEVLFTDIDNDLDPSEIWDEFGYPRAQKEEVAAAMTVDEESIL